MEIGTIQIEVQAKCKWCGKKADGGSHECKECVEKRPMKPIFWTSTDRIQCNVNGVPRKLSG